MGNHKFRLSDMMPNAWFYKLRDMSKSRKHKSSYPSKKKLIPSPSSTSSITASASQRPYLSHHHRRSLYFHNPTDEPTIIRSQNSISPGNTKASQTHSSDPPRNSSIPRRSRRRTKRQSVYKPSPKTLPSDQTQDCYFSSTDQSSSDTDFHASSCSCRVTSSTTDIILDVNEKSLFSMAELNLPPILTKPARPQETIVKENRGSVSIKLVEESYTHKLTGERTRKSAGFSAGVKLRANSPRIASKKKVQGGGRRSLSSPAGKRRSGCWDSFAMVKASVDPQTDFKDSMKEMIVENNIRTSKDLEELLACYLSLNSDQYHDSIVKAFEQIWFDLADLCL